MRYIDADALIKKIYPIGIGDGKYTINAKAVKLAIDNAPTADVVPKSEVEVARKIFEEIEREFCGAYWYKGYTMERYIAKLKKKYTEEKHEKV